MYGITIEQQYAAAVRQVAELENRLERGWVYCDKNPDDQKALALFMQVLKEYESAYLNEFTLRSRVKR